MEPGLKRRNDVGKYVSIIIILLFYLIVKHETDKLSLSLSLPKVPLGRCAVKQSVAGGRSVG